MTPRGPFQPRTFCDSVVLTLAKGQAGASQATHEVRPAPAAS